jgi:uncharacterized protein
MTEKEDVDPACREPRPQDLDGLVAEFVAGTPEVLHAVVISPDGLPLTGSQRMQGSVYADWVSVVSASLLSLAGRAARITGYGAVIQALVAMEWGTLVVMAIDDAADLAVLTTAAELDMVAYAMTMLVEEAANLISAKSRNTDLP